jgi:hypothetical protein
MHDISWPATKPPTVQSVGETSHRSRIPNATLTLPHRNLSRLSVVKVCAFDGFVFSVLTATDLRLTALGPDLHVFDWGFRPLTGWPVDFAPKPLCSSFSASVIYITFIIVVAGGDGDKWEKLMIGHIC